MHFHRNTWTPRGLSRLGNCHYFNQELNDLTYLVAMGVVWKLIDVPVVLFPMLEEQRDWNWNHKSVHNNVWLAFVLFHNFGTFLQSQNCRLGLGGTGSQPFTSKSSLKCQQRSFYLKAFQNWSWMHYRRYSRRHKLLEPSSKGKKRKLKFQYICIYIERKSRSEEESTSNLSSENLSKVVKFSGKCQTKFEFYLKISRA